MKKTLNVDHIANELAGGSAFFPSYQAPPPAPSATRSTPLSPTPSSQHENVSPAAAPDVSQPAPATPVPPYPVPSPGTSTPYGVPRPAPLKKRRMKQRQPFDIYEDQYELLKRIADEERNQGLPGSMSRMVREGIDMYLKARETGEK